MVRSSRLDRIKWKPLGWLVGVLLMMMQTLSTWPGGYAYSTTTKSWTTFSARSSFSSIRPRAARMRLSAVPPSGSKKSNNPMSDRERDIQRTLAALKRQGRLPSSSSSSSSPPSSDAMMTTPPSSAESKRTHNQQYQDKIRQKLGGSAAKAARLQMLGVDLSLSGPGAELQDEEEEEDEEDMETLRPARIGSLPTSATNTPDTLSSGYQRPTDARRLIDPSLFDEDDADEEADQQEESALVDLVEQKLMEKVRREREEKEKQLLLEARQKLQEIEQKRRLQQSAAESSASSATVESSSSINISLGNDDGTSLLTSGVGGSWVKNTTAAPEMYQPSVGSWGAFPRPKDISKAYGGGRRVGPGFSNEDDPAYARPLVSSTEDTRELLRRYREKVGIEVASEKEHAAEIDEALAIASVAMQRGVYSTAVSALEKVTKYCSSNSKVGGKVFLELAMAYEAVGRTKEAMTVYGTLSKCRIEEIKYNAKRLMYGLEAIQFMQNDLRSAEFSRKRARNVFVDTTGMADMASKFDDVYQTAYIDLDRGFYKKLTESVVRSCREARQILLRATGEGEVERLRIVQALRAISRQFESALQTELSRNAPAPEPVAVIDGRPILPSSMSSDQDSDSSWGMGGLRAIRMTDEFVLGDAQQMADNMHGEWKLQLLADKTGDGVKYFNTTLSWQNVDTRQMTFTAAGPSGFTVVTQSGGLEFNAKRRILRRTSVTMSGNNVLSDWLGGGVATGAVGAVRVPQQIMSVDSILMITRGVPSSLAKKVGSSSKGWMGSRDPGSRDKEYFAVWRRVDPGTYSSLSAATASPEPP